MRMIRSALANHRRMAYQWSFVVSFLTFFGMNFLASNKGRAREVGGGGERSSEEAGSKDAQKVAREKLQAQKSLTRRSHQREFRQ